MIQTRYEEVGAWSSSEFGQQFMIDLSDATDTPLFSIGQSYLGAEIYGMVFGTGNMRLMITGGVHRAEDASREAAMMNTRDMAYNIDGKFDELFDQYTVVAIPTVSPDVTTRNNAQGLNINRDAYSLETPEMAALMAYMTDFSPHVYIDFHERSGSEDMKLEFIDPSHLDPNAHIKIKSAASIMEMNVRDSLENKGFATSRYPQNIIGPGMTVAAGALFGSITSTPETHISIPKISRIDGQKETFNSIIEWCLNNIPYIDEVKRKFNDNVIKVGDNFTLLNGNNQYYNNATKTTIRIPEGYQLENIDSFILWKDTYDILVGEDGFVPIEQKSGRLLPHLLDPESNMKVVTATRVEPKEPERRTDGRYTKVMIDGWQEVFIKYM